jgi:hypothetical protein
LSASRVVLRWGLAWLLAAAAALASPWAAPARAGTYSWPLPTASAPGAWNPDHDSYGATPWTYVELMAFPPTGPSAIENLPTYSDTIDGGLTGWYDDTDPDQPFVAVDRGSAAVGVVPPGQLALQPARDRIVGIGWTSPLDGVETISVSGTFSPDRADALSCGTSQPGWALELDGQVLASGSGPSDIAADATVSPGDTLYLLVGASGLYQRSCDTAGVTLRLEAPSTPPTVSISTPAPGQVVIDGQPRFSGRAGAGFGDQSTVKVGVWPGSRAGGTPLEVLTAVSSGGTWSASPVPPLGSGTYTAQAEQRDAAGDVGLSRPVTFKVDNRTPTVTVRLSSRQPLVTFTPRLEGTAGTRSGDSATIMIEVWAGRSAHGNPLRVLRTRREGDGRWSVRVTPGLPNGRYVAVASQLGPGGISGLSRPLALLVAVPVIDGAPTLDRDDRATVTVACGAATGPCTGYVLVDTVRPLSPIRGGPRGPVRVLFAYVQEPAATVLVARAPVAPFVAAALRRAAPVRVRVSVEMRDSLGRPIDATAVTPLVLVR